MKISEIANLNALNLFGMQYTLAIDSTKQVFAIFKVDALKKLVEHNIAFEIMSPDSFLRVYI